MMMDVNLDPNTLERMINKDTEKRRKDMSEQSWRRLEGRMLDDMLRSAVKYGEYEIVKDLVSRNVDTSHITKYELEQLLTNWDKPGYAETLCYLVGPCHIDIPDNLSPEAEKQLENFFEYLDGLEKYLSREDADISDGLESNMDEPELGKE